eukprot:8179498-Pyramimonas_sp.AAC.1
MRAPQIGAFGFTSRQQRARVPRARHRDPDDQAPRGAEFSGRVAGPAGRKPTIMPLWENALAPPVTVAPLATKP